MIDCRALTSLSDFILAVVLRYLADRVCIKKLIQVCCKKENKKVVLWAELFDLVFEKVVQNVLIRIAQGLAHTTDTGENRRLTVKPLPFFHVK